MDRRKGRAGGARGERAMRPVPPDLARALSKALHVEQSARRRVRRALRRQVDTLDRLRALGVPATLVAIEVAKASGASPSPEVRRRIAARLRKLRSRVTGGHALRSRPPATAAVPPITSMGKEEPTMARLIKKTTTTEEYLAEDGEEFDIESDDTDEDEESDEEEPSRRSRKARDK